MRELIVLVEIPESQGPAVRSLLARTHARGIADLPLGSVFRSPDRVRANIVRLAEGPEADTRLAFGQIPFGLARSLLPPEARYATVLRDPVQRAFAQFRALEGPEPRRQRATSGQDAEPSVSSLGEALERFPYLFDNVATRLLSGLISPVGALPPEALERAKQNLQQAFELFVVCERPEDSATLLRARLGVRTFPEGWLAPLSPEPIDDESIAQLEERTADDRSLYEFANQLLDRAIAEAGEAEPGEPETVGEDDADPRERRKRSRRDGPASAPETLEPDGATPATGRRQRVILREQAQSADPAAQAQLVAYLHIPRCAGSTMRAVFTETYGRRGVRTPGNVFRNQERAAAGLQTLVAQPDPRLRIVMGQIPFGLFKAHMPPGALYMTLLREPLERMLSHYDLVAASAREAGGEPPSLEAALAQENGLVDNLATRLLSGLESPFAELAEDALERAKASLRDEFDVVGLTSRLEDSIGLVESALEVGLAPLRAEGVAGDERRVQELSERERGLLEERNRLDVELYAFAVGLFEEAVAGAAETPTAAAAPPPRLQAEPRPDEPVAVPAKRRRALRQERAAQARPAAAAAVAPRPGAPAPSLPPERETVERAVGLPPLDLPPEPPADAELAWIRQVEERLDQRIARLRSREGRIAELLRRPSLRTVERESASETGERDEP